MVLTTPGIYLPKDIDDLLQTPDSPRNLARVFYSQGRNIVGIVLKETSTEVILLLPTIIDVSLNEHQEKELTARPFISYPLLVIYKSSCDFSSPLYAELESTYYRYLLTHMKLLDRFLSTATLTIFTKFITERIKIVDSIFIDNPLFMKGIVEEEGLFDEEESDTVDPLIVSKKIH